MIAGALALRPVLEAHRRTHAPAKQAFFDATDTARADLLREVAAARDAMLDVVLGRNDPTALASAPVRAAIASIGRYAGASDWNLIDVGVLALCLPDRGDAVTERLAAASLAFHALRMVDDAIDGHRSYKNDYPTMLGELTVRQDTASAASTVTLLAALPLLCEGLCRCPSINDALQRTVFGALHEALATDPRREYDAIVVGKMVSYGLVLYGPVIAAIEQQERRAVTAFLQASFRLGQLANDLLDAESDAAQGQPNYWNIHGDDASAGVVREMDGLVRLAAPMADRYQPYASARICDLAGYGLHAIDRSLESHAATRSS
jgi:hypothetical protein